MVGIESIQYLTPPPPQFLLFLYKSYWLVFLLFSLSLFFFLRENGVERETEKDGG